jgi:site-specific recombinase XerC
MASPRPPGHEAIKVVDWPAADRGAYERACVAGSPFDEGGAAAQWRPATHRALTGAYARWLGYLLGVGVDLAGVLPPDRVTPERISAYIRLLAARCAPVTVSSYLGQLHMFLRDVWPDRDWSWLCAMQARRARLAEPTRQKAARVVPQADLLRLGLDLMARAETLEVADDPALRGSQARLFRDGLMVATLALRPLRQRNFLARLIGRHLRQAPDGWSISVPASESKTHIALTMSFPELLVPALERYLEIYRPHLLAMRAPRDPDRPWREAGAHLWIAATGMPMTAGALQKLLRRHTRARFGHEVNCHLFRDCLATSLADDDPAFVRLAADLLGHRSFQTTQRHYIAAHQRKALRRCQATIMQHRAAANRPGARPSR